VKNSIGIFIFLLLACIPLSLFSQNAKQFYKTGLTFVEAGNYEDAIDQFTRALNLDPEYVKAYVDRAASYEAVGKPEMAADDLKRALTFEDGDYELYYNSGRLYFELQRYNDGLDMINKSLALYTKSDIVYRLLSRTQMALDDLSSALIAADKALSIKDSPENFFYHGQVVEKMKNYDQAETDYNNAITGNNRYTEAYLALAKLRLHTKKLTPAMETCNSLLSFAPGNKEALLTRSRIYAEFTEYPKAIDDISTVLFNNPDDKNLYLLRGNYYLEFTQHQNAINDFSKALLLDPGFSEAVYKRAYTYEQVGDYKSAIKDYESLTQLSSSDIIAQQHLNDAKKRLFELNREADPPKIEITDPLPVNYSEFKIAKKRSNITVRGKITDASNMSKVMVNNVQANIFLNGDAWEFTADVDITATDFVKVLATDIYDNISNKEYSITRTEIDPPLVSILAPYASDNGEIYLDTDNTNLYIEGTINDESTIRSIFIDGVAASFALDDLNPKFTATINVANKNKFNVTATDNYGNDTVVSFVLNREGVSLLEANPMGRTWVVFIENSNYETFPSLDGPVKDVTLMRSALARYDIHKIIHKQDMTKKDMERFFSIELRDLLRSNKVNALLIWYAGHGKFINETGYWIPVDAKRDDEFTYYNLNALRASLQSYTNYITHNLVITDACESGPTFYQAMRETPRDRNCNNWEDVKLKSSQVFSSAGYELAVDNSQFTRTFANTLANNPDACLPIDLIVNKVTLAVSQNNQQKPKFGRIAGLEDEDGTFFFMSK